MIIVWIFWLFIQRKNLGLTSFGRCVQPTDITRGKASSKGMLSESEPFNHSFSVLPVSDDYKRCHCSRGKLSEKIPDKHITLRETYKSGQYTFDAAGSSPTNP